MHNLYQKFFEKNKSLNKNILISDEKTYSFSDIEKFSAQLANKLRGLSILVGDCVAVQVEKSAYNLFLYLACLRSGIIFLPLNNTYTLEELSYFFNDANPKLIVCDPSDEEKIATIKNHDCLSIKTMTKDGLGSLTANLDQENTDFATYQNQANDTAVILYTSGTTGKPKGAMITHSNLTHNARDLVQAWGIKEADVILHMLPVFHVHGLFFAFHTALLASATILLRSKFDIDDFFQQLPYCTVFMGVPTYYMRLLQDPRLNKENCKFMRLFISGSAPLLTTTFNEFQIKTKHSILERYGMTETGINTSNPLNGLRKVGTVGLPLPNVRVRIVNDHNKQLAAKQTGNIEIKGTNLFKGYWKNPDKTRQDFTDDGYFKTGDLGFFDEEGYLTIVGRSKDMIITGGLNVYPKEIELTLDSIDGILESAVIGIPHPDFGEAVIAVIVSNHNLEEAAIIAHLKKHHAAYKCPKKILIIDQLPKNTMGKVQKNILREKFVHLFQGNVH